MSHKIAMQQLTKIQQEKRDELRKLKKEEENSVAYLAKKRSDIKRIEEDLDDIENTYELLRIAGGSPATPKIDPTVEDDEDLDF